MRMTLLLPAAAALLLASALDLRALPPIGQVTIAWDYPSHGTNITFNVYQSTTLNPASWVLLTNTPLQQITIPIRKAAQFFAATAVDATNIWHESDFSAAVGLPDPPPDGTNLRVTLLQ